MKKCRCQFYLLLEIRNVYLLLSKKDVELIIDIINRHGGKNFQLLKAVIYS